MAFQPHTLKSACYFTREGSNDVLTLEAGETVLYEVTESDTHRFRIMRVTRNGYTWRNIATKAKELAGANQHEPPPEPEPTPQEPDPIVVVPNCSICQHYPMVRMGSNKGWRCGAPGNRWVRKQWTVCPGTVWDNPKSPKPNAPVPDGTNGTIYHDSPDHEYDGPTAPYIAPVVELTKEQEEEMAVISQQQREVRRLNKARKVFSGRVFQINYYIPSRLEDFPNPCRTLKRCGALHLDGSNFMVPEEVLQHRLVKEVFAEFAAFKPIEEPSTLEGFVDRVYPWIDTVELTKEQIAAKRERVVHQLSKKLLDAHRSLIERIDLAGKKLQEEMDRLAKAGGTEKDQGKADNAYNGAVRAALKDAFDEYEHCLNGAVMFDDRPDDEDKSLDLVFDAARKAIRTRALLVNDLLRAKRVKLVAIPASIGSPLPTINHNMRQPEPVGTN